MKYKFKLGFILLISFMLIAACCDKKSLKFTVDQVKVNSCLQEWGDCKSYIDLLQYENDHISNFLKGIWLSRMKQNEKADSLFQASLNKFKNYSISEEKIQTYWKEYLTNKLYLDREVDIYYEDSIMDAIGFDNIKLRPFLIDLLFIKAMKLMEMRKANYAYSTILFARHLENTGSKNSGSNYYLGILNLREGNIETAKHNFKLASIFCSDFNIPICKKIYLLSKHVDTSNNSLITNSFIDSIYIDSCVAKKIYKDIETHLAYLQLNNIDFESATFFQKIYLIEKLIQKGKVKTASKFYGNLNSTKVPNNYMFMCYSLMAKLSLVEYKNNCSDSSLYNIIKFSTLADRSFTKNNSNFSLHFADYLFQSNSLKLEYFYKSNDLEIFETIIKAKDSYDRITNLSYELRGKKITNDKISQYAFLVQKIENHELSINNYKNLEYSNYLIFQELYFLYDKKYKLEKALENINQTVAKVEEDSTFFRDYYNTVSHFQVFDFIATDSSYYMTYFNPDTVIKEKYDKSSIDTLIKYVEYDIENKTITEEGENANRRLFSMIQPYLNSKYGDIIIVPDQELANIPFEMIKVNKKQGFNTNYLGDLYNVSYNYNIKYINIDLHNLSCSSVVAFSYSDFNTINSQEKKEVIELPNGFNESKKVLKNYPKGMLYSGMELSKNKILNNLDSPILHFSTHSSSSNENMLDNYIYVRNKNGKPEKMYGFEIKHQKMDNSLVILSSCNSGTGTFKPGAGVFSLSRDFLQAGAQTVIKSLWAVNEISTAELMVDFHKNFTSGYTASMSLTLAKRKLKQNSKYALPYYWAGFVLEGNPNVILSTEE